MSEPVFCALKQAVISYSSNRLLRYNSTSGGYVSASLLWLFKNDKVKSTISYSQKGIEFSPEIIFRRQDYHASGSIYQEINLINFIKGNIDRFVSPVAVTCLPCQAKSIRSVFEKAGIDSFIISLVCSAQMSLECTKDYIHLLGFRPEDVTGFCYRGGGWPSSVKASFNNSACLEDSSLWHSFFHSFFFHQKRCLSCQDTFGIHADLAVSDPWLGERVKGEKDGKSIVFMFTDKAENLHKELVAEGVVVDEVISVNDAISSQKFTMKRKSLLRRKSFFGNSIKRINRSRIYKSIVVKSPKFLKLHTTIVQRVLKYGMRNS